MIRLLLVEEQRLVRESMKEFLQQHGDIEVVAEVCGGEEAIKLALQFQPDIVVMDVILPDMGGIEATELIRKRLPDTGIVIVTAMGLDIFHRALRALRKNGVQGFVSKNSSIEELREAVLAVSNKTEYLSRDITEHLVNPDKRNEISFILDEVPDREFQVLLLTTQGKRNNEIADLMFISQKTVYSHRRRVYDRLHIRNDVQLIHWALHHNLVKWQYPCSSTDDE